MSKITAVPAPEMIRSPAGHGLIALELDARITLKKELKVVSPDVDTLVLIMSNLLLTGV